MIDVHAHFQPSLYLDAMRQAGLTDVDGFPLPQWSAEDTLAVMDQEGIDAAILSISSPGVAFANSAMARTLCRAVNHYARELVTAYPRQFGAFALLPLPDIDGALAEISYCLDELGLDGIGLYTNYGGRYLGDPLFEPILAELDRRGAVAFVHPTKPPGFDIVGLGFSAPLIEYPFDTTRTIVTLLQSGTLQRHTTLKLIFSHGGGTVPYLAPRITHTLPVSETLAPDLDTRALRAMLRRLHYDLTAAVHPGALAALSAMVPPSQLLAGFDYPFMRAGTIAPAQGAMRAFSQERQIDLAALCRSNALALFPRFAP